MHEYWPWKCLQKVLNWSTVCFLSQGNCVDMFNIMDDHPAETKKASFVDVDLSKLEMELRDFVIKQEVCVCLCLFVCKIMLQTEKHWSIVSSHHWINWLCCMYLTLLMGSFVIGPAETVLPWISGLPWPIPSTVPGRFAYILNPPHPPLITAIHL